MRLDEFIKETLLQIAKGVQGAIDEQKGFEINPNEKEEPATYYLNNFDRI